MRAKQARTARAFTANALRADEASNLGHTFDNIGYITNVVSQQTSVAVAVGSTTKQARTAEETTRERPDTWICFHCCLYCVVFQKSPNVWDQASALRACCPCRDHSSATMKSSTEACSALRLTISNIYIYIIYILSMCRKTRFLREPQTRIDAASMHGWSNAPVASTLVII